MHSPRVRDNALLVAESHGRAAEHRRAIAYVALLHDIGKITVPDAVLLKPGPRSAEEQAVEREYLASGAESSVECDSSRGRRRSCSPTTSGLATRNALADCGEMAYRSAPGSSR